jgi:hypothetical protein
MDRSRLPRHCSTADLAGAPPADAFRLPVEWREARIVLADGSPHTVRLSMRRDASVCELFEAHEPFLPVRVGDAFHLYARAALACITVRSGEPVAHEGHVSLVTRSVCVRLLSGTTLEGLLRFVSIPGRGRMTDVLNEDAPTFALQHADGGVSFVAKAHVLSVQEQG